MLPQPISDDRALSQSLHQALIKRFSDALTPLNQSQLSECSFGFAPSPTGVKTFLLLPLLCWRRKHYSWISIKFLNECKP